MSILYESYTLQTVKIGKTIYTKASTMHTCKHTEVDIRPLKDTLNTSAKEQGLDVTFTSVKKIRAPTYDYVITEAYYPADSPIIPAIIMAILWIIGAAIVAAAVVYVAYVAYELLKPKPVYCPYCGEAFPDAAALKGHIATAHPEQPQFICPYCGTGFKTNDELMEHIKECPLRPWHEKVPWTWIIGGAVVIVTVPIGYKILTERPKK